MQKVLGNSVFVKTISYREKSGGNEVYCLHFQKPDGFENIYALWAQETGSGNDNGATTAYELEIPASSAVYVVVPANNDLDGDTIPANPVRGKLELLVSEKPQFVVVKN